MGRENLESLARIGKLAGEPPSRIEFEGLLNSARNRLQDAEHEDLNLESRFDLAYNAAHALALAALRWHGYRADSRYVVSQCLKHTVDLPNEQWRVLDEAHRKRNLAEYERDVDVAPALVDAIVRVAREVEARVSALGPTAEE